LAAARLKSERVATTEVLDKLDIPKIKRGVFNPATLGMGFIFLLNNITVQGLAFFLPTIVATIYPGRSVIFQQLRTVPPYVVGAGIVVLNPYVSWKIDRRVIFFIICAPLMIIGYAMFLGTTKARVRYGATFLVASGAYTFGPLSNALVSANVVSDSARTSAIGTNVMFGNIGGLIATWSFLPFDGPNFHIGNGLNLATSCMALIVSILMLFLMNMANRRRDKRQEQDMAKLDEMSPQQIQDLDWKHPGFRWRP